MNGTNSLLKKCGLSGLLDELEDERKQALGRIGKTALGAGVGGAASIIVLHLAQAEALWSVVAGGGAFLVWVIVTNISHRNFVNHYKREVVPRLLGQIAQGLQYEPSDYIDRDEFIASGLFKKPDRYNGKDYVAGRLDKTHFRFSFVHAQEEVEERTTDSDGNSETRTHYETIFKGLFFSADFNKHFYGHTLVYAGGTGLFSGLRRGLVKLEDPDFNRRFTVYSNDQVEARYILSPALMNRLVELRERFDAKVQVSFIGSRVMLAVPSGTNFLEPRFFRRADNPEVIAGAYNFLKTAIGVVEDLKLNTRIWSKR